MLSLLVFSCQKSQDALVSEKESTTLTTRSDADIKDFFDETPCGNIVESEWPDGLGCDLDSLTTDVTCDLYPGCVFKVEVFYLICNATDNNFIPQIYINEPTIIDACPEFDEAVDKCNRGTCNQLFAELYNCLIPEIEDAVFKDVDFEADPSSANSNYRFSFTWLNATCSTYRYLYTLDGDLEWTRVYCNETGCCFRETYLFIRNGEIVDRETLYFEMDSNSGCPSEVEIEDPLAPAYGYTECTYVCGE